MSDERTLTIQRPRYRVALTHQGQGTGYTVYQTIIEANPLPIFSERPVALFLGGREAERRAEVYAALLLRGLDTTFPEAP